jgi:hypothetical protein
VATQWQGPQWHSKDELTEAGTKARGICLQLQCRQGGEGTTTAAVRREAQVSGKHLEGDAGRREVSGRHWGRQHDTALESRATAWGDATC